MPDSLHAHKLVAGTAAHLRPRHALASAIRADSNNSKKSNGLAPPPGILRKSGGHFIASA